MKEIKLTKGKVALVDDEDFDFLNKWKWQASQTKKSTPHLFYAKRASGPYMHRVILGLDGENCKVDHIDRNSLNNQRANLRIATSAQNQYNTKNRVGGSSKYKGVSLNTREKTVKGVTYRYTYWRSLLSFNKKTIHLGYFKDEILAALAYNEAAKKYYGEFANLNII